MQDSVGISARWFSEPGVNRTYQDLADHYGFVVLPARIRRPRDLISRRRHWGEDRIVYLDEAGRLRWIASAWTDIEPADEFRLIAAGRAAFRTVDLQELCRMLSRLSER